MARNSLNINQLKKVKTFLANRAIDQVDIPAKIVDHRQAIESREIMQRLSLVERESVYIKNRFRSNRSVNCCSIHIVLLDQEVPGKLGRLTKVTNTCSNQVSAREEKRTEGGQSF